MGARFSRTRIAAALADLQFLSEAETAARHGINKRTLRRYKASFDPESPLAAEVQSLLNKRDQSWGAELPATLKNAVDALNVQLSKSDADPKLVEALTKTIEVLNDVAMTRDMAYGRV